MSGKTPIVVLGAGSFGSALASTLARNDQEVRLWDRNGAVIEDILKTRQNTRYLPNILLPSNIIPYSDLSLALTDPPNQEMLDILIVVPSHAFRSMSKNLLPFLQARHRIAWATKGLDSGGVFLHQVAEQELGKDRAYAVLSGPSFAKELALGLPTAVTLASNNKKFMDDLSIRFHHEQFRIYTTYDLIGVQLGGVVKNVLAVAVGISDGMQWGANARAALMTRGLSEMMRLGTALGARPETLMGLAGCGDIILSCTDNQSRNRRFGLALAQGKTIEEALRDIGQVVEAVYNIEQLCCLAKARGIELPIAEQVFAVMKQEVSPQAALKLLFRRSPKSE